jgi:hypothetical protein
MLTGSAAAETEWELWKSDVDEWGAFFAGPGESDAGATQRRRIWEQLSPSVVESHEYA